MAGFGPPDPPDYPAILVDEFLGDEEVVEAGLDEVMEVKLEGAGFDLLLQVNRNDESLGLIVRFEASHGRR